MHDLRKEEQKLSNYRKPLVEFIEETKLDIQLLQEDKDELSITLTTICNTLRGSDLLMEEHKMNGEKIKEVMKVIEEEKSKQAKEVEKCVEQHRLIAEEIGQKIADQCLESNDLAKKAIIECEHEIEGVKRKVAETEELIKDTDQRHEQKTSEISARHKASMDELKKSLEQKMKELEEEACKAESNYKDQIMEAELKKNTTINELISKIQRKKAIFETLMARRRRLDLFIAGDQEKLNLEEQTNTSTSVNSNEGSSNGSRERTKLKSARRPPTPGSSPVSRFSVVPSLLPQSLTASPRLPRQRRQIAASKRVRFNERAKVTDYSPSQTPSVLRKVQPRLFNHVRDSRRPTFVTINLNDT